MDGFRGLLWRRDGAVQLLSRSGRDLGPWFPELTGAAESLPCNTLVDGEIVIADESGQADFGALQQRLSLARKFITEAVAARPAILLVFDLLVCAGSETLRGGLSGDMLTLRTPLMNGRHYALPNLVYRRGRFAGRLRPRAVSGGVRARSLARDAY
jgi:hypothetical protein